jgi:chaperonin GroES
MLKPLNDKVLVRPGKAEETTKGGIVLPDTARQKPREGEVLAIGPGKMGKDGVRTPIELNVGDLVVYSEYAGTKLMVNGEELMILSESSVLALKDAKAARKAKK